MIPLNPQLQECRSEGKDYYDPAMRNILRIGNFVRMYRMGIPAVCWLTYNGEAECYWNQWQMFDLIRQNNIHPAWMRKEDHDELYGNHIQEFMQGYPPKRTDDSGGGKHCEHRRRRRAVSQSYA